MFKATEPRDGFGTIIDNIAYYQNYNAGNPFSVGRTIKTDGE